MSFYPIIYKENKSFQVQEAMDRLEEYKNIIKWKNDGGKIMDVGCGDGYVTAKILKNMVPKKYRIVGSDINVDMVEMSNNVYGDITTTFIVLDINQDLPDELKEDFDHVFSFNTLHWIKNQQRPINNLYGLLKEGGTCLVVIVGQCYLYDMYRILSRRSKWQSLLKDYKKYFSPYYNIKEPEKVLAETMRVAGFKNIHTEVKAVSHVFQSWEALKGAIRAVLGFPFPVETREELLNDLIELARDLVVLDREFNDYDSGRIVVNQTEVVGYGIK